MSQFPRSKSQNDFSENNLLEMEMMEVHRPRANDTEEDLLRMQKEMFKKRCKERTPDNSNSFAGKSRQIDKLAGRFSLDLDSLAEEEANVVELTVQERSIEFLHNIDQLYDCSNLTKCEDYAKDEGFPDVLDLSKYYNSVDSSVKNFSANEKSFFAIEFDRLHGRIDDHDNAEASTSVVAKPIMNDISGEIELENLQRIEKMSIQEIEKAKQEIVERFDPKLLDFLRNRAKKKKQWNAKQTNSNLVPQQTEKSTGRAKGVTSDVCASTNQEVTDRIKELEIFDLEKNSSVFHEDSKIKKLDSSYMRLAADAAQLDMATKCMRTIVPRQQQNIIRLFDNLKTPPKDYAGGDDLLENARANLNAIKGLYLEQRKEKDGNLSIHFAEGIDPFGKTAWMLSPIRKVLDVMQKDGKSTLQDLVVVRLSLFWTLLIMVERPTLYYAFATPGEIFVHLAEIFIMGPEIFKDECISQCLSRFLHDYLEPKARDGLLRLVLKEPIAGLDSFESFYEDLLQHFEEFSMGDENFTLFILLGAYANHRSLDSLLMKCAIWTPNRNIVRQMVVKKDSGVFLLNLMAARRMNENGVIELKYFSQFEKLLRTYAEAIRDSIIMKNRNQLVYEIASSELEYFIQLHMKRSVDEKFDMEIMKQYDNLVLTLRQSLTGYSDFQSS
uniref:RPAP1_N domain-containing protein n=1 Tax=Onchocerca volvulus TaxID=6282 RepID=A0A8R1XUW0_ONCVO